MRAGARIMRRPNARVVFIVACAHALVLYRPIATLQR